MQELIDMMYDYETGFIESIQEAIQQMEVEIREAYATGLPAERLLAPHIHLQFDIDKYIIKVKIPTGKNALGTKYLNTFVGREFGKDGIKPDIVVVRYLT